MEKIKFKLEKVSRNGFGRAFDCFEQCGKVIDCVKVEEMS